VKNIPLLSGLYLNYFCIDFEFGSIYIGGDSGDILRMMAYYLYKFSGSYSFRLSKDFQAGGEVYASPEQGALDCVIIV
jgi:hypothetical protein